MTEYSAEVEKHFLTYPAEEFGQAATLEFQKVAKWDFAISNSLTLIQLNRHIAQNGLILPTTITAEMVALSGGAHGCPVTISLAEKRGLEGAESTVRSYLTKNYFDRFTRMSVHSSVIPSWLEKSSRELGFSNPEVQYPNNVDTSKIHGMANPHRYFPAQTFRNLEFFRLGILDDETIERTGLVEVKDLNIGKLNFLRIGQEINWAKTGVDVAATIGTIIARQLLRNRKYPLNEKVVGKIISAGFDGSGILNEHGVVPQVDQVYEALEKKLGSNTTTKSIKLDLVS